MRTVLYEVTPHDPATFAAVTVALLMVAVVGCLGPARRASRISPMSALRAE
jgi:ABC-type lipoprotein release transport system permease subunit